MEAENFGVRIFVILIPSVVPWRFAIFVYLVVMVSMIYDFTMFIKFRTSSLLENG